MCMYTEVLRVYVCICVYVHAGAYNATPGRITRRNVTCYAIRARRRDITARAKRDSYFVEHPPSRTNERTVSRSCGTGIPKIFRRLARLFLISRRNRACVKERRDSLYNICLTHKNTTLYYYMFLLYLYLML